MHDDAEAHAKLQERWTVDTSDRRHNEAMHVREALELMDAVVDEVRELANEDECEEVQIETRWCVFSSPSRRMTATGKGILSSEGR